MITALPPAATMSAAVWRPIPLLPPTTASFCPAKTGMAIGRLSCSIPSSMRSSQFMVIARFLCLEVFQRPAWAPRPASTSSDQLSTATLPSEP